MTDYKSRLISYISSMTHAKAMLKKGIISEAEYLQIDTIIAKKYGVDSCNIYRGIDLIYSEFRG